MSTLELSTRERGWMRARAHDRKCWPTPAAWARALLLLSGPAIVRARAQARLLGGDTNQEFFAARAAVERIADERFVVVHSGDAFRVSGPRQPDDPRPAVIARAAILAGISHRDLRAEADQQEKQLRRARRSNLRGLALAEIYMASLPKPTSRPERPPQPQQPRRTVNLFEPCGGGWFVYNGVECEPLAIDIERLFEGEPDDEFEREPQENTP